MTYKVTARKGFKKAVKEVQGPIELQQTLSQLKEQGLRISTIRRIVVR